MFHVAGCLPAWLAGLQLRQTTAKLQREAHQAAPGSGWVRFAADYRLGRNK